MVDPSTTSKDMLFCFCLFEHIAPPKELLSKILLGLESLTDVPICFVLFHLVHFEFFSFRKILAC